MQFIMNIETIQQIIGLMPVKFDSHDIIRKLVEKHPDQYILFLVDNVRNGGGIATTDGQISLFLAHHATVLEIERSGNVTTPNIVGNVSECAAWVKKNKI